MHDRIVELRRVKASELAPEPQDAEDISADATYLPSEGLPYCSG